MKPAPNTHSSEAFLLVNAYAALQDWDGVFAFAYSHRHDDWNSRRIGSFFDLDQHPTKLATLPRRRLTLPARGCVQGEADHHLSGLLGGSHREVAPRGARGGR